ncbi:hypothetical protein BU15DRAFT_69993 [Melanogaster broomeanus]|nr:hypothetical protein BU15DRAFT_69993 [Melanogaster broomeanus]
MSLIVIRVEFPAYSHSFNIEVPETSTVLDVKQAISTACIGHPRPEGQRIIWRGRYLDDEEKLSGLWPLSEEQHTVHLSVRPSAWTSAPPNVSNGASSSSDATASLMTETTPGASSDQQPSSSTPSSAGDSDVSLAFIHHKHWQALCCLSNFKLAPPNALEDVASKRVMSKLVLERWGYTWPDILDASFPLADPTSGNGLDYEVVTVDGKCYLSLLTEGGTPTPMQVHSLKVLTYTFSILSLPPRPLPAPTPTIPEASSVPPHVNDLLQQLGLPPLRAAPNANVDVTVHPGVAGEPAIPDHAEANIIREIPIRALLAPLLMVVFRMALLLYFFSPARKPLLGLCIVVWIMYEMWTHVRIVILRPQAGGNGAAAGANGAQAAGGAVPAVPRAAQANGHVGPNPARPANAEHTQNGQQTQGPPIPSQSNGVVDSLALTNIHNENKLLWPVQQPPRFSEPPGLLHKATSFVSLLVVTLHPEVYNRRRAALRLREGRLRTEMNVMEHEPEAREDGQSLSEEEARKQELRQLLQVQHARRATWVRQYVDRVRGGDWIEE